MLALNRFGVVWHYSSGGCIVPQKKDGLFSGDKLILTHWARETAQLISACCVNMRTRVEAPAPT